MEKPAIDLQYLLIVQARGIGMSEKGLIQEFDDTFQTHRDVGLHPLGVVAIASPRFKIYARMLFDFRADLSVSSFLAKQWGPDARFPVPSRIEVHKTFFENDRGLAAWLRQVGVDVGVTLHPKSFAGVSAEASRVAHDCTHPFPPNREKPRSLPRIDECNQSLETRSDRDVQLGPFYSGSLEAYSWRGFVSHSRRVVEPPVHGARDFDPSKVMKSRLPSVRRELAVARDADGVYVDDVRGIAAFARSFIGGGIPKFLEGLGIRRRDFDVWISGRAALTDSEFGAVYDRAGLRPSEFSVGGYELSGGYLLSPPSKADFIRLYDELCSGGDVYRAFEVIGPEGRTLPKRFIFVDPWLDEPSIFLVERGSSAEKALGGNKLLGFRGAVTATTKVWDVVQLINDDPHALGATNSGDAGFVRGLSVGAVFAHRFNDWMDEVASGRLM